MSATLPTRNSIAERAGRLFFLDISAGRLLSANPDGSDLKTMVTEGRKRPDGVVLDVGTALLDHVHVLGCDGSASSRCHYQR